MQLMVGVESIMLVLSRRIGEAVVIDNGKVTVTILKIVGDQVRIGITAPSDVSIHREEVYKRILKDNTQG